MYGGRRSTYTHSSWRISASIIIPRGNCQVVTGRQGRRAGFECAPRINSERARASGAIKKRISAGPRLYGLVGCKFRERERENGYRDARARDLRRERGDNKWEFMRANFPRTTARARLGNIRARMFKDAAAVRVRRFVGSRLLGI